MFSGEMVWCCVRAVCCFQVTLCACCMSMSHQELPRINVSFTSVFPMSGALLSRTIVPHLAN
jgi:hypothetical protein